MILIEMAVAPFLRLTEGRLTAPARLDKAIVPLPRASVVPVVLGALVAVLVTGKANPEVCGDAVEEKGK